MDALLDEQDARLLSQGRHPRPYEVLGAHAATLDGQAGTRFAVWAPNARQVGVVGDFNHWQGQGHSLQAHRDSGVWLAFVPGVGPGARYKYAITAADGTVLPHKADPYGFAAELRPATASVVTLAPRAVALPADRAAANAPHAPISIYEVHTGSWRRGGPDGRQWLDWDQLAATLPAYAQDMGFTHIELLPISEHPFDGSWGYQPLGLYAPTARHGDAAGLRRFVQACHARGLGVLLDWVPAHFPTDPHGLGRFDGTHLYEHADPREGFHPDWQTLIFNLGRHEVANYLAGNARYWLESFGLDGLRVDAVASMLYRDYSRPPGEWVPNVHGGRENLEAIAFLQRVNAQLAEACPGAITLAEESTAFPGVTRPVAQGGLGFGYKWNMGWMHDTLQYMRRDPIHRQHHHDELTFGLVYAFDERFVLPLSHDEVVHGKGSMLGKMPGDDWQRFANLRAYYGFMFAHPGKKLLFMGCEFAQAAEWNHDRALDWHLLDDPRHAGVQRLVRDLNGLYRGSPALHGTDGLAAGFEWVDRDDAPRSLLSFLRTSADGQGLLLVVCNFTPVVRHGHRLGVPRAGVYREVLNTDSAHYGGSNVGTPGGAATAEALDCHGRPWSVVLDVPPLATVVLQWQGAA